jgi:hypothetical protein
LAYQLARQQLPGESLWLFNVEVVGWSQSVVTVVSSDAIRCRSQPVAAPS